MVGIMPVVGSIPGEQDDRLIRHLRTLVSIVKNQLINDDDGF